MQTLSVPPPPLPPGTTARQLMAQGMPESSAYHALKRGWYCPGYHQRDYPQRDGPGGFAHLETPERFRAGLCPAHPGAVGDSPAPGSRRGPDPGRAARLLDQAPCPAYPELSALLRGDAAGLIAQHCKRLRRDQQRFQPLEEAEPCSA